MKILLIHTFYQLNGGEDVVFEQEYSLLSNYITAKKLKFYNKNGLIGAFQFFLSIWNVFAAKKLKQAIKEFKPDIIHIHNWHFALGPISVRIAKKAGIPVVLTLHNYRLLCPSASLMDHGELFTGSLKQSFPWEAIKRKVYRDSFLQTFWLAFVVWFHRFIGTWAMVDCYITLTEFARSIFLTSSLNLKKSQVVVKPNFVVDSLFEKKTSKNFFLFVGRLTEEKGVNILLEAFKNIEIPLKIVGEGPLLNHVKHVCNHYEHIDYLGQVSRNRVKDLMKNAIALIFPSIWYEGMPMSMIEAFSVGTPVIASNLGAMQCMIKNGFNGLLFEAGDPEMLSKSIYVILKKDMYIEMGENSYQYFKENFTEKQNYRQAMNIYKNLIVRKN